MLDVHDAWDESMDEHPGIAIIGRSASGGHLALDLRQDPAPVMYLDVTSDNWECAIRQAEDVGRFIERVEAGTFGFAWE